MQLQTSVKGKKYRKNEKIFDPIVTCNLSAGGDMAYFLLLSLKLKLVLRWGDYD